MRNRYWERKNESFLILGGKCTACGSTEKLEIDHIDRTKKKYEVQEFRDIRYAEFRKEIIKCQLLCKLCHIQKTIRDFGKKVAKGKHGTISSYRYCHCDLCRNAKKLWWRGYRKTHPRKDYSSGHQKLL